MLLILAGIVLAGAHGPQEKAVACKEKMQLTWTQQGGGTLKDTGGFLLIRVNAIMINLALPSTEACSVKICLHHGSEPVWDQNLHIPYPSPGQ